VGGRAGDVGATLMRKNRARGRPWQRAGGVRVDLGGRLPRRWSSSVVEPSSWATGNRLLVARSHHAGKGGPRHRGGGVRWWRTSRSYIGLEAAWWGEVGWRRQLLRSSSVACEQGRGGDGAPELIPIGANPELIPASVALELILTGVQEGGGLATISARGA
jgi:hypothetical protein